MGRLAAGTVIALAILARHGNLVRDVLAEEGQRSLTGLSSATPAMPSGRASGAGYNESAIVRIS